MRLKKLFTRLIILSLTLLIIPSGYAADDGTDSDDILTYLEDTWENIHNFYIELTSESVDVHGYDELAKVLAEKSEENSTKRYVINLQDGDYNVTNRIKCGYKYATIKINGNNHTIDGRGKKQFLEVYGNLEVNNLTVQNTRYQKNESAAICMVSVSDLTIDNCTFLNNHGDIKGGAITSRGKTRITGSLFVNNTCESTGGAIWSIGEHGGTLILINNTFKENVANAKHNNERTSVVYMVSGGNNIVENNTFENNTGRCIHSYLKTNSKIINNTFKNNKMAFKEVIRGAVIDNYESDITIQGNVFINDKTNGELRGGLLYHEVGHLEFINNTIRDRHTQTGNVTNVTCSKGGSIFIRNATANIRYNTFKNTVNANMTWGGVIYNNMGNIYLRNNIFENKVNGEEIKGTAIYNDVNARTTISDTRFKSKCNGSVDTENQDNVYVYNSDVVNNEGTGMRGITVYE